mgnify:CR=1 FL=1
MAYRTDDPYADFCSHEREQERLAAQLPECDYCGRTIDDHYYSINGEILCEICMDENFRMTVEI